MITEGYKKKGGKNRPPTESRPEPPKEQGEKNIKDLSVNQLEDLNTFMMNGETKISEIVKYLLGLYSYGSYINEDLLEKLTKELHEWWYFYQRNTEWKTWKETATFFELKIKE